VICHLRVEHALPADFIISRIRLLRSSAVLAWLATSPASSSAFARDFPYRPQPHRGELSADRN
ncbi:MAG: hypothetical protein ACYC4B_22715, partial [Pirellulaceae bacterium]